MTEYLTKIGMRTIVCAACGIVFAAPEKWVENRENDHKMFYCPKGHRQHFPQESDKERLRRQLTSKKECCLRAELAVEHIKKSAVAYKGHVTRLKKKLKDGN